MLWDVFMMPLKAALALTFGTGFKAMLLHRASMYMSRRAHAALHLCLQNRHIKGGKESE